jgi:hypothetical protein
MPPSFTPYPVDGIDPKRATPQTIIKKIYDLIFITIIFPFFCQWVVDDRAFPQRFFLSIEALKSTEVAPKRCAHQNLSVLYIKVYYMLERGALSHGRLPVKANPAHRIYETQCNRD